MARRRKDPPGDAEPTGLRANPLVKLLLADVVVRNAGRVVRSQAAKRFIARHMGIAPDQVAEKPSLAKRVAGVVALRVATRSVPGALVVGGGLLAHGLYKRGKARRAARQAADAGAPAPASPPPGTPAS